ncbi:MAG TPA: DoxX family protein [Polyangiaceae bacterium]|nr:DoxX family protein [Polyangiaceae bacterium]
MKTTKIGYWAATGLVALGFAVGGLADLSQSADVRAGLEHLGYPMYLAVLLGVWKVLGAVAIVVPRLPRLKEWAYAGMFFDLSGAFFSHASVGDPAPQLIAPVVLLGLLVASWALRDESRKLESVEQEPRPALGGREATAN